MDSNDHQCEWRDEAIALRQVVAEQAVVIADQGKVIREQAVTIAEYGEKLEAVLVQMQMLQRQVFGPKSEKMPPIGCELRREESEEDAEERRLAALAKRQARQALKQKLAKQTVIHHVTDEHRECPSCGGTATGPVGEGKRTTMFEYVPGYFVRQEHVQEKVACRCGQYIATADPPHKVVDKGQYGPGFIAHLVVMKCADSIPLYRLAKQYQRLGIPMSRSTLTDLFHAAAKRLAPLYERMLTLVARSDVVQADETSMKMQRPNQRGFIWTFLDEELIVYRFSPSRSGQTPLAVLGGTEGTLVVDAYTGYNRVTDVDGRSRSGCLAHARRKFFDALPVPQSERALALILDVYRIEHEVRARNLVRTIEHRHIRKTRSREAMARFRAWLDEEHPMHAPKTPLGAAIGYALNQWDTLTRFLDDERIPLDNNASERALRVVALGRKNFLFVGDEDNGANLAGLYSLVSTCEAHDVDPVEYLKNVLLRVDLHPASQIDDLLPHRWVPPLRVEIA